MLRHGVAVEVLGSSPFAFQLKSARSRLETKLRKRPALPSVIWFIPSACGSLRESDRLRMILRQAQDERGARAVAKARAIRSGRSSRRCGEGAKRRLHLTLLSEAFSALRWWR